MVHIIMFSASKNELGHPLSNTGRELETVTAETECTVQTCIACQLVEDWQRNSNCFCKSYTLHVCCQYYFRCLEVTGICAYADYTFIRNQDSCNSYAFMDRCAKITSAFGKTVRRCHGIRHAGAWFIASESHALSIVSLSSIANFFRLNELSI